MGRAPQSIVEGLLREYTDRGVIRELHVTEVRGGRSEFRFRWLLERPFRLVVDPARRRLSVPGFLPAVTARSSVEKSLRRLVAERTRVPSRLPAHRRVDPSRAEASLSNRRGAVSLGLTVKKNQYRYGARILLQLVHEIFLVLQARHQDYLWAQLGAPQE